MGYVRLRNRLRASIRADSAQHDPGRYPCRTPRLSVQALWKSDTALVCQAAFARARQKFAGCMVLPTHCNFDGGIVRDPQSLSLFFPSFGEHNFFLALSARVSQNSSLSPSFEVYVRSARGSRFTDNAKAERLLPFSSKRQFLTKRRPLFSNMLICM